jgi:capsular exopolysaccharide synthesis family protein
MTKQPRDFTLSEYFGVIRRNKWLILIVAVVASGAALVYSAAQNKQYAATATMSVTDPNAVSNLVGGSSFQVATQLQLASAAEPQVTRIEVAARVKQELNSPLSITALQNRIAVALDPNAFVLQVTATSPHPGEAAQLANAFVTVDAALSNDALRKQYRAQASAISKRIRKASAAVQLGYAQTLSKLDGAALVATALNVQGTATTPTSPSSPKTARNTIGGLVLGLLLGIAIAIARNALDRRLRHVSEVTAELDQPVVGHIPTTALGAPGLGKKGSGSGSGGPPAFRTERDEESFRILRQNVLFLTSGEARTIVAVTSPMPQEGKSTVAAGLAMTLAQAGKRTLLVECDLRRPVMPARFGLNRAPGLSDYLTGNAEPHQILQPVSLTTPSAYNGNGAQANASDSRLVCITSGSDVPLPAELLSSERFRAFLAEVGEAYDAVILDTAPLLPLSDTLGIIPEVSSVLLCIRLGQTTRDQVHAARESLARLVPRPVAIVATAVKDQVEGYYGYYYSSVAATTAATPTNV